MDKPVSKTEVTRRNILMAAPALAAMPLVTAAAFQALAEEASVRVAPSPNWARAMPPVLKVA